MNTKIVILRKDRTNDEFILREGKIKEGKFTRGESDYVVDADNFRLTLHRKKPVITYYYHESHPKPIPLAALTKKEKFGITSEELNILHSKFFYRILAEIGMKNSEKIILLLLAANVGGTLWLIFLMNELPEKILTALAGG